MSMNLDTIKDSLSKAGLRARKYSLPLFLLFLIGIYSFLAWQVISLNQVEPDQAAVNAKLEVAGVPRIDEDVVRKIQQLQDNSVEVQTLFDQARSNPFQE